MNSATETAGAKTMTTKEAAAAIRKNLRTELGVKRGDVSVRSDNYSMGSTLRIEIKRADLSIADVERIANGFSRIHRCEVTGEILGGGNRYVRVSYAYETKQAITRPVRDVLAMLSVGAQARSNGWTAQRLDGDTYLAWTGDEDPIRAWGLDHAALVFALAMRP